jgi:endonuclease-8
VKLCFVDGYFFLGCVRVPEYWRGRKMPEGDTIFRTAATLRSVLSGKTILGADSRLQAVPADSLIGCGITAVEARGKHLLIRLDNGSTVHSHLGMTGSWHLYGPDQPWQKPRRLAALTIRVDICDCVCFTPSTLELLSETGLRRHPYLGRLGPDLLAGALDQPDVLKRFRRHGGVTIGQAVMDQTIVCGIGNVYKSEILFLTRINPFHEVRALSDDQIHLVIRKAVELMSRNLEGYPRQTRFGRDGGRHWVYGRQGKPCFTCGTIIRMQRQGDQGRSTYWCPTCQQT